MVKDRRNALPKGRSKKSNPIQQAFSKGHALLKKVAEPIDDFYYRELNDRGRYVFLYGGSFVSTLLFALLRSTPLLAQAQQQQGNSCLGWMCGPFQTMVNNTFWNDIAGGQVMLTAIFSAMQVFLVMIFVALVIWLFYNAVKERSVAWPFIALILYIVLVVGSNYAGGLTVSEVNTNGIGFQ